MKSITIITPTFNRGYTLYKCYDSLVNQTNKDFKWMIVDDGSTDNTSSLISNWKKDNLVEIIYHKKDNGGKASALNLAFSMLDTDYCVCLDSDDYFFNDAIELALKNLNAIKHNSKICGLLALRNDKDGIVLGGKEIPDKYELVDAQTIFLNLRLRTEIICFYKSLIVKKYRFPSFTNETFVSPIWLDYELSKQYSFLRSNNRYCVCEYLSDGITKNKKNLIIKNPRGYTLVKKQSFELSKNIYLIIKHGIMYNYGTILSKDKNWRTNVKKKIWATVLRPLGYAVLIKRKIK
jgi:glycosyltransferase involved in cell wall biosynthesis